MIVLVGYSRHMDALREQTHHWPTAVATITNSSWSPVGDEPADFVASVRFTYQVGSRRFDGDVNTTPWTAGEAQSFADRYPRGLSTHVYYDPDDPELSVLDRGALPQGSEHWVSHLLFRFLVLGVVMFPLFRGLSYFGASRRPDEVL